MVPSTRLAAVSLPLPASWDADAAQSGVGGFDGAAVSYLNADTRDGATVQGKPSYSIDGAAFQIVRGHPGWSQMLGTPATVTYAYRATAAVMPSDTGGFSTFTTAQIDQAELAIKAWSEVANIHFVRIGTGDSGPDAYSDAAAILFGNYSSGEAGASAFAMFPGSTDPASPAGDVWINSTLSYNQNPTVGKYGAQVLVHELGHAIGLDHPSDYNAGANATITYSANASYFEDSRQYTVMSYFSETNTGANFGGVYSAAPLLDDIAAAQLEYGANNSTRTGDTVYGFHSNADDPWFLATSNTSKLVFAVWDAGGNDTFDFSGYSTPQKIDLRAGFFSDVGGLVGNVAIAQGVVIENAIGGSGGDQIHGNDAANVLTGGQGADTLTGGGGDDTLDGGAGSDVAIYSGPMADYGVSVASGLWTVRDTVAGRDGTDTLRSIEALQFADQFVVLPDAGLAAEGVALLRLDPLSGAAAAILNPLSAQLAIGQISTSQALTQIIHAAGGTTSVATLAYEFFTGSAPTSGGMDYLVAPAGPNPNNLNSAYYQSFNLENRYINFAVNLGKAGAGAATFAQAYGGLTLFEATRQAYATIFGGTPSDAKLHALLDPTTVLGGVTYSRADYFALYGGDGPSGIGAKAAMVGWLLAEAVKADLGTYALSNDAFLADVALHNAPFGVDIIGHYAQSGFAYQPG